MPFIDLKMFLHFEGGNDVNITSVSGYSGPRFRIVRVGCPDILDENPDSPDLVAKFLTF